MQDLALPNVPAAGLETGCVRLAAAARTRNKSGNARPVKPRPPTRRTSRRLMPSHRRTLRPRKESMVGNPEVDRSRTEEAMAGTTHDSTLPGSGSKVQQGIHLHVAGLSS